MSRCARGAGTIAIPLPWRTSALKGENSWPRSLSGAQADILNRMTVGWYSRPSGTNARSPATGCGATSRCRSARCGSGSRRWRRLRRPGARTWCSELRRGRAGHGSRITLAAADGGAKPRWRRHWVGPRNGAAVARQGRRGPMRRCSATRARMSADDRRRLDQGSDYVDPRSDTEERTHRSTRSGSPN